MTVVLQEQEPRVTARRRGTTAREAAAGDAAPSSRGTPVHSVDEQHTIRAGRATPPERFDPDSAWRLADLATPSAEQELDASGRLDPYWDGLWESGSSSSWMSAELARRQETAGIGRLPKALDIDPATATEKVLTSYRFDDRLAMLGALFSWRTVTAEQVAAMVGNRHLASAASAIPAAVFASGLMQIGSSTHTLAATSPLGRNTVYRPARGHVFEQQVKPRLTLAELMSVTGGQAWAAGTGYDRHNVLSTELGLRLAEYTDVVSVLGERFSSVDHLVGSGTGRKPVVGDQTAADLVAVRDDGMRVAVEMTATIGQHFYRKVERWARILAENPMEATGLTVVFVTLQHPDRLDEGGGFTPRARTYQAIASATKQHPGSVRDRVAERMGVATWREWFPARGLVHDAFFTLRVDRPTGRGDALWQPCDMLDPTDGTTSAGTDGRPFTPHPSFDARQVVDNAALLGQTPHWLRDLGDPPDLSPGLLRCAGWPDLPETTPLRPGRAKGHPAGKAKGAAGDTQPPRRMLPPPHRHGAR